MTVTSVQKDLEARTMSLTAQFDASVERVWEIWSDPRQLERWWGPPTYPATVVDHELTAGGAVSYYMTGPDGDKYRGWWRVLAVEAPHRLEFEDGFADEGGTPDLGKPTTTTRVTLRAQPDGGTRMDITSTFPTSEAMEQMIAMGMEEGITAAVGQVDEILASPGG